MQTQASTLFRYHVSAQLHYGGIRADQIYYSGIQCTLCVVGSLDNFGYHCLITLDNSGYLLTSKFFSSLAQTKGELCSTFSTRSITNSR